MLSNMIQFLILGAAWALPSSLSASVTLPNSVILQGQFSCGKGVVDNHILLNCNNAYLHGINFAGNPHSHAMTPIQADGHFSLEIPFVDSESSVNEMTFILRSLDEDRTLGVFFRKDDQVDGGLTESFFINQNQNFGLLKITKKREVIVPDGI